MTQPLVHPHFGSKQGLWRAAMDELFAEVRVFTEPAHRRVLGTAELFVRFVAARPEVTGVIARVGAAPSQEQVEFQGHQRYLAPLASVHSW